jgi:peptidoglycan/LPS O-acetylase OafA/YrhL
LIPLTVRVVACVRHPGWDEISLYDALYYRTHSRFDTLIAGVTLAYVQRRWRAPIARWLQNPAARAALALPALTCLWLLMNPLMFGQSALALVHAVSWGTLTSLMYFAWTLLILNGGDGWMQRALSLPVFRRIATLGYGVYLVHLPLCEFFVSHVAKSLVERHGWRMVAVWPGSVVALFGLSLAVSYLLHIAIEKPSLRLRDRLAV